MAQTWEDFLQEGALFGVIFDFLSTDDEGGAELDNQIFPGRDAARVEDRARKQERHEIIGIFFDDAYPDTMNQLLAKIRAGGTGEFVHPVFGTMQVAVEHWSIRHDIDDARDCAALRLTLVEHLGDEALVADETTLAARANAVRSDAASTQQAGADLYELLADDPDSDASQVQAAQAAPGIAAQASAIADLLELDGDILTVSAIASQVNGARSAIDGAISPLEDFQTGAAYEYSRELRGLGSALAALAQLLIEARPPLVETRLDADQPLLTFVHGFYRPATSADLAERVAQVMALNPVSDPTWVPAGTSVRLYAR